MLRYIAIVMVIIFSNCSNTRSDCSKNYNYAILDSLLSGYNSESTNAFFYNPDFNKRFLEEMCRNVGAFHTATYCELQPRFNQQRSGVVFIHDKNSFFSFYQRKRGSKLEFSGGEGKIKSFYDIVTLLKNDFIKRGDSIKKVFENKDLSDAPFLRVTQVKDSSGNRIYQSFIFPYVPEH